MIVPEDVTDEGMTLLAREIAKKIEEELEYPGQIKVNLVRDQSRGIRKIILTPETERAIRKRMVLFGILMKEEAA